MQNTNRISMEKIIHWFAQNLIENFSDVVSLIPIGLENRWYLKNGKIKSN